MTKAWKFIITLVPVVTLFLVTGCTLYYNHINPEYLPIYDLISNVFGFGLMWLPVYFYMQKAYHLCSYTLVSLYGLTAYSSINIAYSLFPIGPNEYAQIFESATLITASTLTLIFIFQITIKSYVPSRKH